MTFTNKIDTWKGIDLPNHCLCLNYVLGKGLHGV